MRGTVEIEQVATELLSKIGLQLISCKVLQSLWAGYGHICQVTVSPSTSTTTNGADHSNSNTSMILKYINPPTKATAGSINEGHIRKILSYQIEQFFYTNLAPQMPSEIAVASCLASSQSNVNASATAMILEDLKPKFPIAGEKRAELNEWQIYAALQWLARFHGFWWTKTDELYQGGLCRPPLEHFEHTGSTVLSGGSVWLNGGYTYLATRRSEYADLATDSDSEWSRLLCQPAADNNDKSAAELVASLLTPDSAETGQRRSISRYITLIHGDVKSENLFTTNDGKQIAFFDFQYVGLGLGVCDLAKLFTCSVPMRLLDDDDHATIGHEAAMGSGEEKLLRFYHAELIAISGKRYDWDVLVRHWETALVDWLRFQASWGFWGNTEWLESRVRSILADGKWRNWLEESQK